MAQILAAYKGPVAPMSFDPDHVATIRELIPERPRGIIAERYYKEDEWQALPPKKVRGMPPSAPRAADPAHFVAYWINELPAPAPWIARNIFGCALLNTGPSAPPSSAYSPRATPTR